MAIIIYGWYRFARSVVAYRRDYCLSCDAERTAFQRRAFYVLHVFWLPLLPLGFWRAWQCAACAGDPHVLPGTRRSILWLCVACLALLAVAFWAGPLRVESSDAAFIWSLRVIFPLATLAAAWALLRRPPDAKLSDKLRTVQPLLDPTCPLCGVMLMPSEPRWRCPKCGIERAALPAS